MDGARPSRREVCSTPSESAAGLSDHTVSVARGLVTLDLDDTLVATADALAAWFEHVSFDWNWSVEQLDAARALKRQALGDYRLFGQLLVDAGLSDIDPDSFAVDLRSYMARHVRIFPGVAGRLRSLREHNVPLVVVTNGRTDQQVPRIRSSGLERLVDGWVTSEMAGAEKPDGRPFQLARNRFAPAAGTVHSVGDTWKDVAGARAAGFLPIWVSHGHLWDRHEPAPDLAFRSTVEALDFLIATTAV